MGLRKHQWLLALLAGVLLGVLAMLLTLRGMEPRPEPAAQAAPSAAPSPSPTPDPEPTAAPSPAPATPAPTPDPAAQELLERFLREQPGRWSLCWQPLPSGEAVTVSTDSEPMVSASLIKLFIMGAVYERVESGELPRDSVYEKLSAMITVSDNSAANELIRMLGGGDAEAGMAAVNDWCARQGYADTRLKRLMLVENGLQNETTAADCAAFLAAVYRGECVSASASEEMLALLLAQQVNDRLPARLPAGTPVAHKTGDLSGLCCADAGIVFCPGGDYILCAVCNDPPYDLTARDAIAELSARLWELRTG